MAMMAEPSLRRWQWKEFRADTFTHFYDLQEGGWNDLGPTGTLRVKNAWVNGSPVGTTFFMTQDTMISVKITLLAVLPQGAIFCRSTFPRIWVAVREKPNLHLPRRIINLDVHAQEIDEWTCDFTSMSGTILASTVVRDGATIEDAVVKVDHLMPQGQLKLIVGTVEVTPRNIKSLVGGKLHDSWDQPPVPQCFGGYGDNQGITEIMERLKNKDFSCSPQLVDGKVVEKAATNQKSGGKKPASSTKKKMSKVKDKNPDAMVKDKKHEAKVKDKKPDAKVKKQSVNKKKTMKRPSKN